MVIYGNPVGGALNAKTYELQYNGGTTPIMAVVVDEEKVFDATANDVRTGKKFATNSGVVVGTKDIPAYETRSSSWLIRPNEDFVIPFSDKDRYDYTKIQCIIVEFKKNYDNTVVAKYFTIDDNLFSTETFNKVSTLTKDSDTKSINFNITNNSDNIYEIMYFTYKEI